MTYTANERVAFKLVAESVLQKLGEVVLDKHQFGSTLAEDSSASSSVSKVKADWLGIGTEWTWHGYPDTRFRIDDNETTCVSHDDSDKDSPGNSTVIEAKLKVSTDKLMQLVTTAVVVAFTEKNIHQDLGAMIPTIMLTPTRDLHLWCTKGFPLVKWSVPMGRKNRWGCI